MRRRLRLARRRLGWLVVAASILLTGCDRAPTRPNVLFVMVDTLRADYLGIGGFQGDISPHLDAFAGESVRFDGCIAPAPWTSPSVASAITSLQAQNHCVANGYGLFCEASEDELVWSSLSEEATTLAEVFRDGGYATAGFVGNWVVKSKFGFGQGFEVYREPEGEESHIDHDGILISQTLEWLDRRDRGRPFFLYLHLMDVHAPYRITAEDIDALRDSPSLGEDRPLTEEEIAKRPPHLGARIQWPSDAMANRLRNWRLAYAAGVRRFDRVLGEFLDALRERGLFENTVVVVTADHGEEFLEHGEWEHSQTYYQPAVHVPLIVRLPGPSRPGRVDRGRVGLIDVMPTLIGLTGLGDAAPPMQGTDLGPRLRGEPPPDDRWVFSTAAPLETSVLAAVGPRYKMILDLETGDEEIYDLETDPGELNDLAVDDAEPLRGAIGVEVTQHLEMLRRFPSYRPSSVPLSDEDVERLRALGYLR